MEHQSNETAPVLIGDFIRARWDDACRELHPDFVQAFTDYVDGGSQGNPPKPPRSLSAAWVNLLDTGITIWMVDYAQILQCLDCLNPEKQGAIPNQLAGYHLSFWHQLIYNICEKTRLLIIQSIRLYLKDLDRSRRREVEVHFKTAIEEVKAQFGVLRPQLVHGSGNEEERTSWSVENWESMVFLGGEGLTAMEDARRDSANFADSIEDQRARFQRRSDDTFAVFRSLAEILGRLEVVLKQGKANPT